MAAKQRQERVTEEASARQERTRETGWHMDRYRERRGESQLSKSRQGGRRRGAVEAPVLNAKRGLIWLRVETKMDGYITPNLYYYMKQLRIGRIYFFSFFLNFLYLKIFSSNDLY
jgi:hypothetical protein